MLGRETDQVPITLSRGLIAAYWSVCWPAGMAAILFVPLVSSLWELDGPYAQFTFPGLLYIAVHLVVQAAILPRLFKQNARSFFLASVGAAGDTSPAVPVPPFRALHCAISPFSAHR